MRGMGFRRKKGEKEEGKNVTCFSEVVEDIDFKDAAGTYQVSESKDLLKVLKERSVGDKKAFLFSFHLNPPFQMK